MQYLVYYTVHSPFSIILNTLNLMYYMSITFFMLLLFVNNCRSIIFYNKNVYCTLYKLSLYEFIIENIAFLNGSVHNHIYSVFSTVIIF